MTDMKVVYGVPWIEVEYGWGSRPSGWMLFTDKERCIEDTKKASDEGNGDGGYIGPVRPEQYVEIPFDFLDDDLQKRLEENGGKAGTHDFWSPKFKSEYIK